MLCRLGIICSEQLRQCEITRIWKYVGRIPKWQNFYSTEATDEKKLNDATYLVKLKIRKQGKIVHINKIRLIKSFC